MMQIIEVGKYCKHTHSKLKGICKHKCCNPHRLDFNVNDNS